jgi:hypothetical protein
LIAAIQAAQKRNAEAYKEGTAKDSVKPKTGEEGRLEQQRAAEMNAFQQRYNRLISKINDPKQRTQLDVLEF